VDEIDLLSWGCRGLLACEDERDGDDLIRIRKFLLPLLLYIMVVRVIG